MRVFYSRIDTALTFVKYCTNRVVIVSLSYIFSIYYTGQLSLFAEPLTSSELHF